MTETSFYIAVGVTLFLSLLLLIGIVFVRSPREAQRLYEAVTSSQTDRWKIRQKKTLEESFSRFAIVVRSGLGFRANDKLKQRLEMAGFRDPAIPDLFFLAQLFMPLAGAFGGSFAPNNKILWICALAAAGYLAPDIWLTEKVRRRKQRIVRSMPDAIDLLVICVDAGLGLDQALLRVGEEIIHSHRDIHEEFSRVHLEQSAGMPRLETWQNLALRTQIAELAAFVSMLTQADRFGIPIVEALSRFADDIRLKRRQKVEEAAAKTKIKIIFPLVFCIFPSLFIVLLAPAFISIAKELKGFGK
jgi:tight adherence protein C